MLRHHGHGGMTAPSGSHSARRATMRFPARLAGPRSMLRMRRLQVVTLMAYDRAFAVVSSS